jgi:hypothetical protein
MRALDRHLQETLCRRVVWLCPLASYGCPCLVSPNQPDGLRHFAAALWPATLHAGASCACSLLHLVAAIIAAVVLKLAGVVVP